MVRRRDSDLLCNCRWVQRDFVSFRFCLSVFLYLCAVVPPIWYLQLDLCRKSVRDLANNETYIHDGETASFEFAEGIKVS